MNIKKIILTGSLLIFASGLFAQAGNEMPEPWIGSGSSFFICILAGVLLAMGFQVLLTMMSAATGITAVGNIRKAVNTPSGSTSDSAEMTAGKISTGMGLWAIVTCSLSLFFASLLAVKLSLTDTNFIGVTLGLVIWAAFFTGMVYLEMKTISSLAGGLIHTATKGIGSIFRKSDESREKNVAKTGAQEQARAMRKELERLFDHRDIDKKIHEYITMLKPQRLDMDKVKTELKDFLSHLEMDEERRIEDGKVVKRLFIQEAGGANISKEDINKLSGMYDEISGILKKDAPTGEKAKEALEELTGADKTKIEQYQDKIKQYLQAADKEALQPERIEKDINDIFRDPSAAGGIIKEKVAALDHDTLVKMVSSRTDISPEDAEKYTGYVEKAIAKISGVSTSLAGSTTNATDEVRSKIRNFIASLEEKRTYDLPNIKRDFTDLFNAAENDSEGLIYKLEHYNKEQLLDMISTNTSISRDQAEPIVSKIVEARDTVMEKAHEVKQKVSEKLEEAKQETLQQAENARKAAATAAWWMTATAIISGIAAALGGLLALDFGF